MWESTRGVRSRLTNHYVQPQTRMPRREGHDAPCAERTPTPTAETGMKASESGGNVQESGTVAQLVTRSLGRMARDPAKKRAGEAGAASSRQQTPPQESILRVRPV